MSYRHDSNFIGFESVAYPEMNDHRIKKMHIVISTTDLLSNTKVVANVAVIVDLPEPDPNNFILYREVNSEIRKTWYLQHANTDFIFQIEQENIAKLQNDNIQQT